MVNISFKRLLGKKEEDIVDKIDSLKKLAKKKEHTVQDLHNMNSIIEDIKKSISEIKPLIEKSEKNFDDRISKLEQVKEILLGNYAELVFDIHMEGNNAQMIIHKDYNTLIIKHHVNQAIVTVTQNGQILIQPGPQIDHTVEELLNQSIESIFGRKPVLPQTPDAR